MRSHVLALTFCIPLTLPFLHAQEPTPVTQPAIPAMAAGVVPNSFIVMFASRPFTLDALREATLAHRSPDEVATIVAGLDASVKEDQAGFVAAVTALGGAVTDQWWIINGACVSLPAAKREALAALPNVASVTENRIWHPGINDARNSAHHNSAAANLKKDAANVLVRGKGISVAVLDTGVDGNMGGTGRPHRSLFPGGNPANQTGGGIGGSLLKAVFACSGYGTEDAMGHGTFCTGCVGANQWPFGGVDGMAPDAWIIGVKISDNSGTSFSNWLITGWQTIAGNKVAHNILAANNSFSGSPDANDPTQLALDNAAYTADILCVVAAGNNGTGGTANSQSAFNGLSTGSIDKNSLAWSGFSSVGPLYNWGGNRTYPDIAAVGSAVNSTLNDSETQYSQGSGTSFASPFVAGIVALTRQAGGATMRAIEAKAVLLNSTNFQNAESGTPNTSYRNQKGLGIVRADSAVDAALAGDYQRATLSGASKVRNYTFAASTGVRKNISIAWMRDTSGTIYNLDLRIYDTSNVLVASDTIIYNSYAKVSYVPTTSGSHRAEVTWNIFNPGAATVEFAISGVGKPVSGPPTLTGISPGSVPIIPATQVTLTGTNLDSVTQVTVGGTPLGFTALGPTSLRFVVPSPFPIGTHNVTVSNPLGTSGPQLLQVTGVHPAQLAGSGIAVRGYPTAPYRIYSDNAWNAILFVSLSNAPSVIPGTVNLGIGNAFTNLFEVGVLPCDASGYSQISIFYPTSMPSTVVHFQALVYDPLNPFVLPFETTALPVLSVSVY